MPKAGGLPDRFIEIEGTPELIVEIISDSSLEKDTQRLLAAYHTAAAVPEYWLVDAWGQQVSFQINVLAADAYQPADRDADGFQYSAVLACRYRLQRRRGQHGYWRYTLESQSA